QCRADTSERSAHLCEHRAERPAEPVGNLLEREAALLAKLDNLTLGRRQRAHRVADRRSQFALEQPRVGRIGQWWLRGFENHRRPMSHELTSQVIVPDI